jgi:tetratricopeptide (TPR) repeat protein
LLDRLVEGLPAMPVLLLVTYRPEYRHAWGNRTYYRQLRIDPLMAAGADELLDAVLGQDVSLGPLKRLLVERTEGNPFLLEESVRTLVETGTLAGARGGYRLTHTPETLEIPATAQAMLAARIDRLAPEDKRLLQSASVIGKDVPFRLLEAIADMPDGDLRRSLSRLQTAEFLYEAKLFPDVEYTFKHSLTHEVTYGGLLHERRRTAHARIVGAIEHLHEGRLTEHLERLAHHAFRGELREGAVHYLRQAGLKAAAQSALHHARASFEQALGVLGELPESQSTLEQAFEIRLELRPVLSQLGEIRQGLERLREADILATRLGDDRRLGRVWAYETVAHSLLGELDEALVTAPRALKLATRGGDLRLGILATTYLEQAHYFRGDYERVVELATANLAALPADWVYENFGSIAPASVYDRLWLVISLAQLGRFVEAASYEAEAIRLAEPTQHAFTVGIAHHSATALYPLKGDWTKARASLERGITALRAGNVLLLLLVMVPSSAWVLAQLGETTEALHRLREGEQLQEHAAARGVFANSGWDYQALGRAGLLLGRLDDAQRLADRALESSPRHPGFAAHALHLLGDIASHPERFDAKRGEAHYLQALALAEPRGMRPLVAHCHLGLGKLYRRTVKQERAREHLTTATTMYREMDMRFWLEQAEAEMGA